MYCLCSKKAGSEKKSDRIYGSFDKGKGCECPGILKSSQQKLLPFVFLRQKDNPPLCTAVLLYMLSLLHTYNCATYSTATFQIISQDLVLCNCCVHRCSGIPLSLTNSLCHRRHGLVWKILTWKSRQPGHFDPNFKLFQLKALKRILISGQVNFNS